EHAQKALGSARIVMMRVPESISLLTCKKWASTYLNDRPNSPIDAVYLYQCTVASDKEKNFISHAIEIIPANRYETWATAGNKGRRGLIFDFPIGLRSGATKRIIV